MKHWTPAGASPWNEEEEPLYNNNKFIYQQFDDDLCLTEHEHIRMQVRL